MIERKTIRNNVTAEGWFATPNVELEVAILKSHQVLFERCEFKHNANANAEIKEMPLKGLGKERFAKQYRVSRN